MKKLTNILLLILFFGIIGIPTASSMKIIKLGKGGVVHDPNGSQHICPEFAFRKCATIEFTLQDLWDWVFTPSGGGTGNITNLSIELPQQGELTIFDGAGEVSSVSNVTISWVSFSGQTEANMETHEITVDANSTITVN